MPEHRQGDAAGDYAGAGTGTAPPPPPWWPWLGVTGLDGAPEQGVFDLLQRAFELYRTHAKTLLTVAAVVFVPGALAHACARAVILAPTMAAAVNWIP